MQVIFFCKIIVFINDFLCLEVNLKCYAVKDGTLEYRSHTMIDILCLTPLSAIFQLYHGDQF